MRLGTNGIVVNELGKVLLIQRNDTRTFAPPGGGLEKGELPTENIAREIREETGIIALPVRLVSLNFWPLKPDGHIAFTFRCIQRGGELQTSPESPRVGFYGPDPLPAPMLSISKNRIEQALKHSGGPIDWYVTPYSLTMRLGQFFIFNVIYRWLDFKRKLRKQEPYIPPPIWQIDLRVILSNEQGEIYWLLQTGTLPGGPSQPGIPPWATAVTHTRTQTGLTGGLQDLSGVYVKKNSNEMTLVFTAQVAGQPSAPGPGQWLPADTLPQTDHTHILQFLKDRHLPETQFAKI